MINIENIDLLRLINLTECTKPIGDNGHFIIHFKYTSIICIDLKETTIDENEMLDLPFDSDLTIFDQNLIEVDLIHFVVLSFPHPE